MPDWSLIRWPMIVGACYFGGQFFTVLALRFGDVSMVAPMMGCKVLFVGLYSTLLGLEALSFMLWISAFLTAIAIFLLGYSTQRQPSKRSPWLAVSLALLSCSFFAGVDTSVGYAGQSFGPIPLLVLGIWFFALASLFLIPLALREPPAPAARKSIVLGNVAFGAQAIILNLANALLARPTVVNIIYSSRGLFGITHTWFFGHYFGNVERHEVEKWTMIRRFSGALLLTIAILLVVLG